MLNNAYQAHTFRRRSHARGVLIIEMLTAFAIVSVTLVITAHSFISANKGNAVTQRATEVADALSYMLADMTREAKLSNGYSWNSGNSTFSMTRVAGINEQVADTVSYALSNGGIQKTVNTTTLPITPNALVVSSYTVTVIETGEVRRAIVTLEVEHRDARAGEPPVYIQTTLAERFY